MNRRDFLTRFLATAAGAAVAHTLDVDKLLWVAGEKRIFLPPAPVLIDRELGISIRYIDKWPGLPSPLPPAWQEGIKAAAKELADEIDRRCYETIISSGGYAFERPRDPAAFQIVKIKAPVTYPHFLGRVTG